MDVKTYYDNIAKVYDSLYHDKSSRYENSLVSKRLRTIVNKKRVLDLGCGTGLCLELCKPKTYVGIDISQNMLREATIKHNYTFLLYNLNKPLPFIDEYFDVVVSLFSSLSYLINFDNIVNEIYRVLKDNGKIYIMVLSRKNGKIINYSARNAPLKYGKSKVTTFTKLGLKKYFNNFKTKVYHLTNQKHTLVLEGIKNV